jgi:hypothetical protein
VISIRDQRKESKFGWIGVGQRRLCLLMGQLDPNFISNRMSDFCL